MHRTPPAPELILSLDPFTKLLADEDPINHPVSAYFIKMPVVVFLLRRGGGICGALIYNMPLRIAVDRRRAPHPHRPWLSPSSFANGPLLRQRVRDWARQCIPPFPKMSKSLDMRFHRLRDRTDHRSGPISRRLRARQQKSGQLFFPNRCPSLGTKCSPPSSPKMTTTTYTITMLMLS